MQADVRKPVAAPGPNVQQQMNDLRRQIQQLRARQDNQSLVIQELELQNAELTSAQVNQGEIIANQTMLIDQLIAEVASDTSSQGTRALFDVIFVDMLHNLVLIAEETT